MCCHIFFNLENSTYQSWKSALRTLVFVWDWGYLSLILLSNPRQYLQPLLIESNKKIFSNLKITSMILTKYFIRFNKISQYGPFLFPEDNGIGYWFKCILGVDIRLILCCSLSHCGEPRFHLWQADLWRCNLYLQLQKLLCSNHSSWSLSASWEPIWRDLWMLKRLHKAEYTAKIHLKVFREFCNSDSSDNSNENPQLIWPYPHSLAAASKVNFSLFSQVSINPIDPSPYNAYLKCRFYIDIC